MECAIIFLEFKSFFVTAISQDESYSIVEYGRAGNIKRGYCIFNLFSGVGNSVILGVSGFNGGYAKGSGSRGRDDAEEGTSVYLGLCSLGFSEGANRELSEYPKRYKRKTKANPKRAK